MKFAIASAILAATILFVNADNLSKPWIGTPPFVPRPYPVPYIEEDNHPQSLVDLLRLRDDDELTLSKIIDYVKLRPFAEEEDNIPISTILLVGSLLKNSGVFGKKKDDDDELFLKKLVYGGPHLSEEDNFNIGTIITIADILHRTGVIKDDDDDASAAEGISIGTIIGIADILNRAGVFGRGGDDDEISKAETIANILGILRHPFMKGATKHTEISFDDDERVAPFNDDDRLPIGAIIGAISLINNLKNKKDDDESILDRFTWTRVKNLFQEEEDELAEEGLNLGTIINVAKALHDVGIIRDDDEAAEEKFDFGTIIDIAKTLHDAGIIRDDDDEAAAEKFDIGTVIDIAKILHDAGVFGRDDDQRDDDLRVLRDDDEIIRYPRNINRVRDYFRIPYNGMPALKYEEDEVGFGSLVSFYKNLRRDDDEYRPIYF